SRMEPGALAPPAAADRRIPRRSAAAARGGRRRRRRLTPRDVDAGVDVAADRAIMAFIRESRKAHELPRVGPFALLLTAATRLRFLNYAIPDDGADPHDADLDALVAAFRTADRTPRVEFLPSVAPALEARLTARGWPLEARLPLMPCTLGPVREPSPPDGIVIDTPSD